MRSGRQQNKGSLGTRTAWPNITTLGSNTETSKLEISFLERSWALLGTIPKGSSAPIGKDLTELRRGRGKALTTWRRWKDRNYHTHGTPSTYESITSRSGSMKTNLFLFQQILVILHRFIIYFSFLQQYFFFKPKGQDLVLITFIYKCMAIRGVYSKLLMYLFYKPTA